LEVLLDAPQVGVPTVYEAALGGSAYQEGALLGLRGGKVDNALSTQVVKVAYERLELSDHPEHIGMADGTTDLPGPPWTVHLSHDRMCLGEGDDGGPSAPKPVRQRD